MGPDPTTRTVDIILDRIRSGDDSKVVARAAENLLRRAEPIARTVCRAEARALPAAQVEELVQDALEVVWRRLDTFDQQAGRFESWVRGICKNVCANARRRKRDVLCEDGVIEATSPQRDALRLMRKEERERFIIEAIEALAPEDQDILYHRYVHGFDRQRIAELLELQDAGRVKVVLQRASRRMRAEVTRRLEVLGHGHSLLRTDAS